MTANVTMLLPMLGACFMAMLVPTLMHDAPIYDLSRELNAGARKNTPRGGGNLEMRRNQMMPIAQHFNLATERTLYLLDATMAAERINHSRIA